MYKGGGMDTVQFGGGLRPPFCPLWGQKGGKPRKSGNSRTRFIFFFTKPLILRQFYREVTPLYFWFPTKVQICTEALSPLLLGVQTCDDTKSQPSNSFDCAILRHFFRISGKTGSRIRNFFGLKPKLAQDGANKKNFSQIGAAVPEEIGCKHTQKTNKQTSSCL